MKNYITIYKRGYMYYVKDSDAVVLHFILNYRIKNNKIYFTDIDKVIKCFNKYNINYKYNNKLYEFEYNRYFYYYTNGQDKIKLIYIISNLKRKINKLNLKERIDLFNKIDELLGGEVNEG